MTLLKDEKRPSKIRKNGKHQHYVRFLLLKCDQCGLEFERCGPSINAHSLREHHFCCKKCTSLALKSDGILRQSMIKVWFEHYGVLSPLEAKECQEKSKQTCQEKYGVNYPGSAPELILKRQQTCLEKYGCITVLTSEAVRDLRNTPEVKKRHKDSVNRIDFKKRNIKSHDTMKRNGTYAKSKTEDKFYDLLLQTFKNVDRQITINGWPIDFYVQDIDTFVQFDGVYWHGLDRDIEIIKEFKTPRDKIIYYKFCNDQKQNKWFEENNKKLIRITDKEFKERNDEVTQSLISS